MTATTQHQSWLFYSPLAQQAALLRDDLLDPVDRLLEDPDLVELVRQCLARHPAPGGSALCRVFQRSSSASEAFWSDS
jgi:hypothetical protein